MEMKTVLLDLLRGGQITKDTQATPVESYQPPPLIQEAMQSEVTITEPEEPPFPFDEPGAYADEQMTPAIGQRPWSPEQVQQYLTDRVIFHGDQENKANKQQGGLLAGMLKKVFGAGYYKPALVYLTTVASTTKMTDYVKLALLDWIEPEKDEATGDWIPGRYISKEANDIKEACLKEQGQAEMELNDG
jgi:hypothetical protein